MVSSDKLHPTYSPACSATGSLFSLSNLAFCLCLIPIEIAAVTIVDGFNYPVGPRVPGAVTQSNDGDGWFNAQDFRDQNSSIRPPTVLLHTGEDWNTETFGDDPGKPVYAVANGTLREVRNVSASIGDVVVIEHPLINNSSLYSVYLHVDADFTLAPGTTVRRDTQIATIADVSAFPDHLHFELRSKAVVAGDLYITDFDNSGYYLSGADLTADGFTLDPSDHIDTNRELSWNIDSGNEIRLTETDLKPAGTVADAEPRNLTIGGVGANTTGTLVVDGATLFTNGVNIGVDGKGTFQIVNGGLVRSTGFAMAENPGAFDSLLEISGAGSEFDATVGDLFDSGIGRRNKATVRVTDGAELRTLGAALGETPSGVGLVFVNGNGSTWTNTKNQLQIGRNGFGSLFIADAGQVFAPSVTIGRLGGDGSIVVIGSGSILDAGGFLGVGPGEVRVRDGGIIIADVITVGATGELYVNGTLVGDTTISDGGLFAPGSSIGTANLLGDLILNGGVLQLERQSGLLDQLHVSGRVLIDGSSIVELYLDLLPPIIDLGDFFTASLPFFLSGFGADNIHVFTSDRSLVGSSLEVIFGANSAIRTAEFGTTAAPEPTTFILFAIALAGFGFARRLH